MIDQTKVTSGFDVEFLMGEEYIRYFLLCSLETGSIPWWSETVEKDSAGNVTRHDATIIHPPAELNQRRLYPVHPDFLGHEHPFQAVVPVVYSFQEEEFKVTILPDGGSGADIRLRIFPSIIQNLHTPSPTSISNVLPIDLDIRFEVVFRRRGDGLVDDVGLQLELLDISGPLIDAGQNLPEFSKEETLQDMKKQIDRRVPFAMSGGGILQRLETRKFLAEGEAPSAIGVYINLVLQDGPLPISLVPDRGDPALAQNFLEAGEKMAFAFPRETYTRLGRDFKFKMAEPKDDDPGEFHFPIRDGDDQVGIIKGISVYAERVAPGPYSPPVFNNVLVIDVHGEYAIENFFDPDFHMRIRLVPTVGDNGLFDFDVDFDLSLSAAAYLVAIFLTTALSFILPKLGLSLLILSILTLKIIEKVGGGAARGAIEAKLGRGSFLDALPHKLLVELRRWDPLYFTHHRVETADVDIQVNQYGFAFDAREMFIGRAFSPLENMVIRSETRDGDGALGGLIYRANDLGDFLKTDLVNTFAATDRMPYLGLLPPAGDIESHRVSLSLEQIEARIAAKDRHLKEIDYLPKSVDVIENQIYQILAVSTTEIPEIESLARGRLRNEIRASHGAAFRQQAIEELQNELGRPPTEAEITARVNEILERTVSSALPSRLRTELDHRMKFDLEPHEFADLQKKKILVLGRDQLDIRKMTRDGKVTIYYRDYERPFEPNTDKRDNLLSLPRYKHQAGQGEA
jgi:hypothetical protein